MNMKTRLAIILILWIPESSSAAGFPENPRIVASVIAIDDRLPPADAGIFLKFIVHTPVEYRGTQFSLLDTSRKRRAVRTEFEIGTLLVFELPPNMISGLRRYKVLHETNERKKDAGVKPDTIRETPTLPHLDISRLPRDPSPLSIL